MRTKLILGAIVLLVFAGSFVAKTLLGTATPRIAPGRQSSRRIVSMSPSITETFFALGLGDRVVGVTRFCNFPPEVRHKARIGGHLDPNIEAIVALRPDLVVMLVENEPYRVDFHRLGLNTLVVCHQNVEGILESIPKLGNACGAEREARVLAADIRARLDHVRRKVAGRRPPRVMVAIDRALGSGTLRDVWIAASDGYCDEIIVLAGGRNACRNRGARCPVVSIEGIVSMNPEVIVDLAAGVSAADDPEASLADWRQVAQVEAVRNHRVHVLACDYAVVPGPRFILLVEQLARLFYPELDWEQ